MKVIVSGGGTAGHIFPALAVAQELKDGGADVLFVGANGKMEMQRVPQAGFEIKGLPIVGIKRSLSPTSLLHNLKFPFKLLKAKRMAKQIIKEFTPDVVVGFGGYASAPIVSAAQKLGVPTVIQEQNSYAGLANKMLAKRAKVICVAYDKMERFFGETPIVKTGNPLRVTQKSLPKKSVAKEFFGFSSDVPMILVTGGSLGTRTLNEMVFEFLKTYSESNEGKNGREVQLIWQMGKFYQNEFEARVKELELPKGVKFLAVPFIDRMDMAYGAADVVICRAGASTVSELQLLGVPTLFVPSPNVAEDHQTKNAMAVVEEGGALMVKDVDAVAQGMQVALGLVDNQQKCEQMSAKLKSMGKPNSTRDVAELIKKAIKGNF